MSCSAEKFPAHLSILIVEDEVLLAMALEDDLLALGHTVVEAVRTGEAAVDAAARTRPDLVLMDVNLAGTMDGIEAAGLIAAQSGCAIIFLTAHTDSDTIGRMRAVQPLAIATKPVDPHQLVRLISDVSGNASRGSDCC